jgi:hypothetical protein
VFCDLFKGKNGRKGNAGLHEERPVNTFSRKPPMGNYDFSAGYFAANNPSGFFICCARNSFGVTPVYYLNR